MDSGRKFRAVFFIAGCDASELFEEVEETLDEVALGVEREIHLRLTFAVGFGRGHWLDMAHGQGFEEAVGVVTLVGDEGLRLDFGQQPSTFSPLLGGACWPAHSDLPRRRRRHARDELA